tara:strand:- start:23084 stop:23617 length:534 start_codon:yes stop_codon:yes gene_type:complete
MYGMKMHAICASTACTAGDNVFVISFSAVLFFGMTRSTVVSNINAVINGAVVTPNARIAKLTDLRNSSKRNKPPPTFTSHRVSAAIICFDCLGVGASTENALVEKLCAEKLGPVACGVVPRGFSGGLSRGHPKVPSFFGFHALCALATRRWVTGAAEYPVTFVSARADRDGIPRNRP